MKKYWFYLLAASALLLRFWHLGEIIEGPHDWRQADTANYIWDFYQNGVDLFHPSVCWMGAHKTLLLEFPLLEAIVAWGYHIFGPYHIVAKLIFLGFFIGSVIYFFKLIKFLSDERIAQVATLIYLFSPLSIFYSRAIQIDFAELFFVFGMMYFFLKSIRKSDLRLGIIGSAFALLAFLTKAPYALVAFFPMIYVVFKEKKLPFVLKTIYLYLIPVVVFYLWQRHSFNVNNAAPDWSFIPGYRKFTNNNRWYYGTWEQRLFGENWSLLGDRILYEVTGIIGLICAIIGMIIGKAKPFFWWWLLGTVIYVCIFFNLNVVHNYYQIPFVPVLSVFIAVGILGLLDRLKAKRQLVLIVFISLIALENGSYAFRNYFTHAPEFAEVSQIIRTHTKTDDLVVVNWAYLDCKFPIVLYGARRNGWHLSDYKLNSQQIYKLMLEGADYFFSVRATPLEGEMADGLSPYKMEVFQLSNGSNVYMYTTDFHAIESIIPAEDRVKVEQKLPNAFQ